MKSSLTTILILSLVAITMVGIVIGWDNLVGQQKLTEEQTIVMGDQAQKEMSVSLTGICPGDKQSYLVVLQANKGDKYNVTLSFEQTGKTSLAKFIDVEIYLNGQKIDEARLDEYLAGKQREFAVKFDTITQMEMEIVYSMGLDVGDEAQNTEALFDVVLSVES